ncbi:MAG: glycosyltransferase family 2 protein [bacterium]
MDTKELSIIVTSYKSSAILKICLNSIIESLEDKDINYELIVLDSATEEETSDMIEESFPDIKFFPHKKNMGTSKLWNEGFKMAKGKFIGVFNADLIFEKDAIEKILNFMKKNAAVGFLGPALLDLNGKIQFSCYGCFYTPWVILCRRTFLGKTFFGKRTLEKFLMKKWDHKQTKSVHWIMGSAMVISREALEKVGPMDERFFLYFEDTDWCRRAWEAGFKVVYFPEAKLHHYHGRASAKRKWYLAPFINKYARIHIKSALIYFWKNKFKKAPIIE